jgi:hypothetical protein
MALAIGGRWSTGLSRSGRGSTCFRGTNGNNPHEVHPRVGWVDRRVIAERPPNPDPRPTVGAGGWETCLRQPVNRKLTGHWSPPATSARLPRNDFAIFLNSCHTISYKSEFGQIRLSVRQLSAEQIRGLIFLPRDSVDPGNSGSGPNHGVGTEMALRDSETAARVVVERNLFR